MRARALCDGQCKVFDEAGGGARSSFFSEVISSVSDLKFSPDGRLMLARGARGGGAERCSQTPPARFQPCAIWLKRPTGRLAARQTG
jgi:hypothetical protein